MLLIAPTLEGSEGGSLISAIIFIFNIAAGLLAIAFAITLMISLIVLCIRLIRFLGKKLEE